MSNAFKGIYFQPVAVILLVQAVKNVQTPLVYVLVMLVTRAPNVILLVDVIPLVQVVHHVIRLQVNALAIVVILVPHVLR